MAMVGLVLLAHDTLAKSFLQVLQYIVGPQEQILALGVEQNKKAEKVERELDRALKQVNSGEGVVILTDLFGGSAEHFSLARMLAGKVEVVSGMNLAMLLKAVDLRSRDLSDPAVLARAVAREGRENIVMASEILGQKKNEAPKGR